jgi:thiol-disulfide isomerase/thioredoxin
MKRLFSIVLISCLILCTIGYVYIERYQFSPIEIAGNPLYKLKFVDSNNQPYELRDLQGKVAVVNFWATYCGPCRDEMPDLSSINDAYQGKEVIVLGVAANELDNIKDFLELTKVTYRNVAAEFDAIELSNDLGNESSVLPFTVILDQKGNILDRHAGRIIPEKIREIVDLALTKK